MVSLRDSTVKGNCQTEGNHILNVICGYKQRAEVCDYSVMMEPFKAYFEGEKYDFVTLINIPELHGRFLLRL